MENILTKPWFAWVVVGVFFLMIELVTTALVSIWFVFAAVLTAAASVFVESFLWQLAIFLILSAVFMILFRNIYKKRLKKTDSTINPKEQLIGKTGKTVEPTDAHGGKILVGDVYWRAVTGGEKIEKDKTAVITDVKGTSLIIKSEEEKGE